MTTLRANIFDPQLNKLASANEIRETSFPATEPATFAKARRERRRALIVPREHGAWGLLLVPMITGAGVAFRECSHIFPLILLSTAALALFWLRTPVESLLGTSVMRARSNEEYRAVKSFVLGLGAVA